MGEAARSWPEVNGNVDRTATFHVISNGFHRKRPTLQIHLDPDPAKLTLQSPGRQAAISLPPYGYHRFRVR
jgi:hypothetical protein